MKTSWHVATAAEAFAAAQLARCGWNVSVQYGANQPEYDLIAEDKDRTLKVSVKGSQDGGWVLTSSFLKKRSTHENAKNKKVNYHEAVEAWLSKHGTKTLFCLVQFKDTLIDSLPRMYLATPREIADWLNKAGKGRGDTILYEKHVWTTKGCGAGTIDAIPESWRFTEKRLEEIARKIEQVSAPDTEKHRARFEKVVPSPTPRPPRG